MTEHRGPAPAAGPAPTLAIDAKPQDPTMAATEPERRTTVVPFTAELLPRVRAFSEHYWSRPRSDDYYEWRYLRPLPFSRMFVAMREDECVGTLFALRKTWRVRAELQDCLEVFDWHSLPELRGAGVGIRLMRAMMRQPERIFSVGGTADVHSTLPLMGWLQLGTANAFELTLSAGVLADRLSRSRGIPRPLAHATLLPLSPFFGPRRRTAPAQGTVTVSDSLAEEVRALYDEPTSYGLVQQPDFEVIRWLTASRWSGSWRFLHFHVGGRIRGWAMTRTYLGKTGVQGSLVEVFTPRPDPEFYAWMVAEASLSLMRDRPTRILARAICPTLREALTLNKYRHSGVDSPLHTWPKFREDAPSNPHFTMLHSDAPFLPYLTELHDASEHP
jgi:hypothetical protein